MRSSLSLGPKLSSSYPRALRDLVALHDQYTSPSRLGIPTRHDPAEPVDSSLTLEALRGRVGCPLPDGSNERRPRFSVRSLLGRRKATTG